MCELVSVCLVVFMNVDLCVYCITDDNACECVYVIVCVCDDSLRISSCICFCVLCVRLAC